MLDYLLKSGACLIIFYAFYIICLEKENMHLYKRIYLLAAIVVSFVIPFVTFTAYTDVVEQLQPLATTQTTTTVPLIIEQESVSYLPEILWSIYGLGVLVFSIKFIKNLYEIINKIRRNPMEKKEATVSVLLKEDIVPHTFFNFIFFNRKKYITQQIPEDVILHEQTHAKQKHSIDVLLLELLQVIFWFNPILILLKNAVKLNHEFLADQAVLNKGTETHTYQNTLLAYSSHAYPLPLANAINYSSIKKRFTVMKTHTSKKKIWIRSFILLPLLALLLYSFSTTIQQDKATPKQVAEYNVLAKKYNNQPKDNRVIKLKDINRLEYLYNLMTPSQKKSAEPFPDCPPPPPAPETTMRVTKQFYTYKDTDGKDVKVELQHDGHKDFIAVPPPPPLPANATEQEINDYNKVITTYENQVEKEHEKLRRDVDFIEKGEISNIPPPPPPMSPVEFIKHNAKKGHTFYYEGYEISSKQAIDIARKNDAINLLAKGNKVTLSKEPITIEPTSNKLPKNADYILDNKNVSYEEASKVNNNSIESVNVVNKDKDGKKLERSLIYIDTKKEKNVVGESERPITYVNGKSQCEGCVLELTKEKLAEIILSIDKGEIIKFNIKFSKKPSVRITNSTVLNDEAKAFLNESKTGDIVQIFGLKSSLTKSHSAPVLFKIVE